MKEEHVADVGWSGSSCYDIISDSMTWYTWPTFYLDSQNTHDMQAGKHAAARIFFIFWKAWPQIWSIPEHSMETAKSQESTHKH